MWLEPGADQQVVIETIKERPTANRTSCFISTHRELREAVVRIMEQSFVVNYAVEIVAIVVAIFSVINTLLASVLDRTREIGVCARSARPKRKCGAWSLEAGAMGLIGGVLGFFRRHDHGVPSCGL